MRKGTNLAKKNKEAGKELFPILICHSTGALASRRESNAHLVPWVTIVKDLPTQTKNDIFALYWSTWKAVIDHPHTAHRTTSALFGNEWAGHWGWWLIEAFKRKTKHNWQGIISNMRSGIHIDAYDRWPVEGRFLFQNDVLSLVTGGGILIMLSRSSPPGDKSQVPAHHCCQCR
jgi:hypothetical protein